LSFRDRIKEKWYRDVFKEPEIRGELRIDELVWRQIERTNTSASQDENLFASNVRTLMSLLPRHKRTELEARVDEYTYPVQRWEYKYCCGVPMGTPEEPVLGSPRPVEELETDWYKLYEMILNAFEECGLSWKVERETIEIGRVTTFSG